MKDFFNCIIAGEMFFTDPLRAYGDANGWSTFELNNNAARRYQLMDKYDCAEFKDKRRQALANQAKMCIDPRRCHGSWNDSQFMEHHYDEISSWYGGEYPEDLYPVLAEVWRKFSAMNLPCPKLDAVIEGNPALALAIAKSYRDKLNRVADNVAATKETLKTSI